MKAFNIVFCILFIISAALQYNDVDPYLWVPIYLYGAWLCYMAARNRYLTRSIGFGMLAYLALIVYYLVFKHGAIDWFQHHPAQDLVKTMKAEKPWIEETREVMGLMILVAVLAVDWFVGRKRKQVKNHG